MLCVLVYYTCVCLLPVGLEIPWASWICEFIVFITFGGKLTTLSANILCISSFSWRTWHHTEPLFSVLLWSWPLLLQCFMVDIAYRSVLKLAGIFLCTVCCRYWQACLPSHHGHRLQKFESFCNPQALFVEEPNSIHFTSLAFGCILCLLFTSVQAFPHGCFTDIVIFLCLVLMPCAPSRDVCPYPWHPCGCGSLSETMPISDAELKDPV